mmetsp:Transcript_5881/g.8485  ORF Transcript_5881/g.8485 Transcript_5881/m.8485 type:complete len:101 (-) Transcript_5881:1483-1785(-)
MQFTYTKVPLLLQMSKNFSMRKLSHWKEQHWHWNTLVKHLDLPTLVFLQRAYTAYYEWGAHAKVKRMEAKYPQICTKEPSVNSKRSVVLAENIEMASVAT